MATTEGGVVAKLIKNNNIGMITNSHDSKELAKMVTDAFNNKKLYSQWLLNTQKAAKIYNWESESQALKEIYSVLMGRITDERGTTELKEWVTDVFADRVFASYAKIKQILQQLPERDIGQIEYDVSALGDELSVRDDEPCVHVYELSVHDDEPCVLP